MERKDLIKVDKFFPNADSTIEIFKNKELFSQNIEICFDKSINLPDIHFTNYFNTVEAEAYKSLHKLFESPITMKNIEKHFNMDEEPGANFSNDHFIGNKRSERLKRILDNSRNDNHITKELIYKGKYGNKVRVFITREPNKILLIDPYHLGLPSQIKNSTKPWYKVAEEQYNKHCKREHCLSNLLKP